MQAQHHTQCCRPFFTSTPVKGWTFDTFKETYLRQTPSQHLERYATRLWLKFLREILSQRSQWTAPQLRKARRLLEERTAARKDKIININGGPRTVLHNSINNGAIASTDTDLSITTVNVAHSPSPSFSSSLDESLDESEYSQTCAWSLQVIENIDRLTSETVKQQLRDNIVNISDHRVQEAIKSAHGQDSLAAIIRDRPAVAALPSSVLEELDAIDRLGFAPDDATINQASWIIAARDIRDTLAAVGTLQLNEQFWSHAVDQRCLDNVLNGLLNFSSSEPLDRFLVNRGEIQLQASATSRPYHKGCRSAKFDGIILSGSGREYGVVESLGVNPAGSKVREDEDKVIYALHDLWHSWQIASGDARPLSVFGVLTSGLNYTIIRLTRHADFFVVSRSERRAGPTTSSTAYLRPLFEVVLQIRHNLHQSKRSVESLNEQSL